MKKPKAKYYQFRVWPFRRLIITVHILKPKKRATEVPKSKYYQIHFWPYRRLVITLRNFKAAKAQRSPRYHQLVIHPHIARLIWVKEIAIKQEVRQRRRRTAVSLRRQARIATALLIVGFSGLLFLGFQALNAEASKTIEPAKTFSVKPPALKKAAESKFLPKSEPTHLTIASVGIDADVMAVGQAPDGSIQTPPVLEWITGWYNLSPTPGEKGPSVIVGHVDSYKGISVFWRLRDVKPGDIVEVSRADGKVVKFKVDALKQFDQNAFPTKEVYGNIDHAGLRLITCGGAFDKASGQYTQNTVVYADMVQ